MKNPKPEILNSKQAQNAKYQILNFLDFKFMISDLFRVSSLEFRIWRNVCDTFRA